MSHRLWLNISFLLAILATAGAIKHVQAQSICPYADINLDTDQTVDVEAICEAAQPWAEEGFQVIILLTDYRAPSEEDWFTFLDQAESEAGVRSLSQSDSFNNDALAFEASTASDLPWGCNVTFGERLFNSALDTDEAIGKIKGQMRNHIAAGDPTTAFVKALTLSYEIRYPTTTAAPSPTPQAEQPPATAQTAQPASSFPWLWVFAGLLGFGGLGFGGYKLAIWITHRRKLKRHLEILRARTSNLLNACEPLLRGDEPEETVLYQLFRAYGGERSPRLQSSIQEWLRHSQGALYDAFDLRKKLIDPAVQQKQSLEQLARDWEMLYVTFVGNSERILSLTDDDLHTLLDPMLVLDREKASVQLTDQLDHLRHELAGDTPLKVELMVVDPEESDAEGILGYLDQIKAKIAYVREAPQEAPRQLAEAQKQRLAAKEEMPDPFVVTEEQLFARIDERLSQAKSALEQEQFLRSLDHTADVLQAIERINGFVTAAVEHERRHAEIESITEQGYRPPRLEEDMQKIEENIASIAEEIAGGEYEKVKNITGDLDSDSQRALDGAQEWRTLHEQNRTELNHVRDEIAQAEEYLEQECKPAWEKLQTYTEENWGEAEDEVQKAQKSLRNLQDIADQIENQNSLEEQELMKAADLLDQVSGALKQTQQHSRKVVERLEEVQAAEKRVRRELHQIEAKISQAKKLRSQAGIGIGSSVINRQIKQASHQLAEGRRLAQEQNFIAATAALAAARQLVAAAMNYIRRQTAEKQRWKRKAQRERRRSSFDSDNQGGTFGSSGPSRHSSSSGSSRRRSSSGSSRRRSSTGRSRRR